jgi:CheY-like chemotaxis protein
MELEAPTKPHANVVVLAEDDDDTRQLIAAFLRRDGYEVVEVEDGGALDFFLNAMYAQDKERPALILSDIRMPGCNGLEVVAHVRERDTQVPIVLFSAYMDGPTRREAENLGVSALIGKPFALEELRRKVFELVPPPLDDLDEISFTD